MTPSNEDRYGLLLLVYGLLPFGLSCIIFFVLICLFDEWTEELTTLSLFSTNIMINEIEEKKLDIDKEELLIFII